MQLESHATPPRESPQQRYANLHRAIERGLDSDEIWKELADVSLAIGHGDEAVRCMRRIRSETTRLALQSRLQRLGLLQEDDLVNPSEAPAASDAGKRPSGERDEHKLRDHVVDAFQYLFHQHMPWLVLLTTLAFPLVVGMGGFLTAGGSPLLLTAIAALPGLCVVSLVGAMGRQILLASSEGNGDVPPVPGFADLVDAAKKFVVDATLVLGSLLLPSLLALWLGAPVTTALPGLLIGAFFVPMAWALRHLRGTLDALSPVVLLRAIARSGTSYIGVAAASGALFLPAAGVAWIAFGKPVWVQIAIIGPLCVVPLFLASRLIGTWLDSRRGAIGSVRSVPKPKAQPAPTPTPARATAAPKTPAATARPLQKAAGVAAPASVRRLAARPAPAPAVNPRPATAHAAHAGHATPVRTAARQAAPTRPAAPARPTPPARPAPARAIEGRGPAPRPAAPQPQPQPQPPAPAAAPTAGRVVATGTARALHGAAARRP